MKRALLLLAVLVPGLSLGQHANDALWQSLFVNLNARNLGPTTMGGRVADLAVYEKEPRIFYVATASGGLWRTDNGGMTLRVVFDKENTVSLGAAAVDQNNPDNVWVGTGEGNSRNSTAWGDGVYKTADGGKTWTNMGLKDSHHISRIRIHPKNPNIVFVGALGRLWGPNEERGLYKTTDGGKSWKKVINVDDRTGIIDVAIDPSNPNNMLAASYERMRYAYNYISGGPGSALWKSTDGGNTWKKVTKGLPLDKGAMGRIGLDYFRKNPKIVIATIEYSYPEVVNGTERRNNSLAGTYKSTDGGESWTRTSGTNPRPFYFSEPAYDPSDENRIYVPAVNLHYSEDGGKTFRVMQTSVHVDHHAMWINPTDSNHMIIGEDGGVGQTRDRGRTWEHLNYMPLGQFYAVTYDMRKPYWVYGGLQDNGSWGGPTQTVRGGVAWFDWYGIGGGDGFHVQVDPNDWTTVYSESQGGAIGRIDQTGKTPQRSIRPRAPQGERYRFNWSSPIYLSPHNSRTIYFGGNKLFKSVNRGDAWKAVSPDLTTNDPEKLTPGKGSVSPENTGAEAHCTIITITESPVREGVLWVGTDDGLVQVTQDGGATWTNVTANIPDLPKNTWCSRVAASRYVEGRCYATFDGHRNNDFNPYVYVTEDFGKTWKKLNAGLPSGDCAYVITEGLKNPDLLYLGTEVSLWISLDRGENWSRFRANGFPTVSVHDVVIHPRELDLILGTHGRSIMIMNVAALEEMTKANLDKDVVLTKPQNVYYFGRVTGGAWEGDRTYVSPNTQPGTQIAYYLKNMATGEVKVTITDPAGGSPVELNGTNQKGLNVVRWNGRVGGRTIEGDYRVTLKVGDKEYFTTVKVEDVTKG